MLCTKFRFWWAKKQEQRTALKNWNTGGLDDVDLEVRESQVTRQIWGPVYNLILTEVSTRHTLISFKLATVETKRRSKQSVVRKEMDNCAYFIRMLSSSDVDSGEIYGDMTKSCGSWLMCWRWREKGDEQRRQFVRQCEATADVRAAKRASVLDRD